jgi:hypothetical protein
VVELSSGKFEEGLVRRAGRKRSSESLGPRASRPPKREARKDVCWNQRLALRLTISRNGMSARDIVRASRLGGRDARGPSKRLLVELQSQGPAQSCCNSLPKFLGLFLRSFAFQ